MKKCDAQITYFSGWNWKFYYQKKKIVEENIGLDWAPVVGPTDFTGGVAIYLGPIDLIKMKSFHTEVPQQETKLFIWPSKKSGERKAIVKSPKQVSLAGMIRNSPLL
jgi:hypothetical protein